jgi:hypothetical protein
LFALENPVRRRNKYKGILGRMALFMAKPVFDCGMANDLAMINKES